MTIGLGIGLGITIGSSGQGGGGPQRLLRPVSTTGMDFPTVVTTPSSGDYAHGRYQLVNNSGRAITEFQAMMASWIYTASNELVSGDMAYKVGVEYPLGTKQAASIEKVVTSGATDLITVTGVNIPAGATYYVNMRGVRQVPTTGVMPFSFVTASPSKLAYQGVDSGDYTIPGSPQQPTVASLQRGLLGLAFFSNEVDNPLDCIALFGDSIQRGLNVSWSNEGCIDAGFVPTKWAVSGARLDLSLPALAKRVAAAKLAGTTIACTNYGINDITAGRTVAQLQANYLTHWTNLKAQGFRVYQHTITCRTDQIVAGSDWSAANQTANATATPNIITINDWLRDGAPISGGVAVATGTVGATRIGDPAHPLNGIFDYADVVMTSRNSGIFKDNYTNDGLHPYTLGAAALRPAYAAFIASIAQVA